MKISPGQFEVKCLIKDGFYTRDLITQNVRRSLKGEAGKLVMHLGEDASFEAILRKLERVHGVVESGAAILQRFYNSKQEADEGVAVYGCRLEDTISSAIDRGIVAREQADEMLRSKFWSGLKDERVKNVTRHRVDHIRDFDTLLAEVRAAEQEVKENEKMWGRALKRTPAASYPQQEWNTASMYDSSNVKSLRSTIDEVMRKVNTLEVKMNQQPNVNDKLEKILSRLNDMEKGSTRNQKENQSDFRGAGDATKMHWSKPRDTAQATSSQSNSKGPPQGGRR
ncbi:MAG: hypothetical protein DSY43_00980 [Gammaproteobacteria bacterium]|nr:MAG: hypothetical protein DSY43_00980 [Gammaproteobacteria bacterium]